MIPGWLVPAGGPPGAPGRRREVAWGGSEATRPTPSVLRSAEAEERRVLDTVADVQAQLAACPLEAS